MKKRTKRDLSIFFGFIFAMVAVWVMNSEFGRSSMREDYEKLLIALETAESAKLAEGDPNSILLKWENMRKTKGSLRGGGRFAEELLAHNGDHINVIGFMVPQEEFRNVTEVLLLPIPLECYFCSMPPARDVMFIKMAEGETTHIYSEPVIMNGVIRVNQGPDQKFFYQMENAELGALDGGELTKKRLKLEHILPGGDHEKGKDDQLLAPSTSRRVTDPAKTD